MKNKNTLMILAASLIVASVLTGYFLYSRPSKNSKTTDSQSAKLEQQSSTDDTASIEKDINNTDLSSIDKESTSIQAEINSTN